MSLVRSACTRLLIRALIVLAPPGAARAQARGFPAFFDPSYSFDTRAGLDAGNGGELGGWAWAASASRLFQTGNCKRVAVSAAGGTWDPSGDRRGGFNAGASASYLVNRCARPTSAPNPTVRLAVGGGLTRSERHTALHLPLGIQAGYMIEAPVVRLEPWASARAHYLESPRTDGSSTWRIGVSTGLDVGVAGRGGARFAADFGTGRTAFAGGLSLWW